MRETKISDNHLPIGEQCLRPRQSAGISEPRRSTALAVAVLVAAGLLAYADSFSGAFVFDDELSITNNSTIWKLWPIWKPLCPPNGGETVSGRPIVNLSLAVNYAVSGADVWSYHVANLAIHLLAAVTLFGLLRCTFLLPTMRDLWGASADPLALAIALLWTVHPLQTESVTYVVQRAESLVGLFYLLTLYCVVRGASGEGAGGRIEGSDLSIHHSSFIIQRFPTLWYVASVIVCLLGMATKEVMVTAPLIVLLYDRTFCAGSFREAWSRRYPLYLALAGTWLLLGGLVISNANRGGSAGFGSGISWRAYLNTQFGAIVHYLRLCAWPHPLVLDYGKSTVDTAAQIVPYAILVGLLAAASIVAIWRWPKAGFLGACFFAILAPSSSVVPVSTHTMAEHRMYLPLAVVITGALAGGCAAGRWLVRRGKITPLMSQITAGSFVLFASIACGIVSFHRNLDYQNTLSIWTDTAAKAPGNERALDSLGTILAIHGRIHDAIACYRKAIEINPDDAEVHNNLGTALGLLGEVDAAIAEYEKTLKINPNSAKPHRNLGIALAQKGQLDEAIVHFQKAVELSPEVADMHCSLGNALAQRGRIDEAIIQFELALQIRPDHAETHNNLGIALAGRGRIAEAILHFRRAVELKPDFVEARNNLAMALGQDGNAR